MTGYSFTTHVDGARVAALEDALCYIKRRLLGRMPTAITELCTQAADAYWEGVTASGEPLRIVGTTGVPLAAAVVDERTPEQVAAEDSAAAEYAAWLDSPEAAREEAFAMFQQARQAETEQLYRAWLDEQAAAFARARGRWRAQRRAELRREFATANANEGR